MTPETDLSLTSFKRYRTFFFLRTGMDRLLALSMLFSCLLVATRIIHTGRFTFISLIWNLFLAYVPYFITTGLARRPRWIGNLPLVTGIFFVWLLFIPNTFYIITDLYHLDNRYTTGSLNRAIITRESLQWFDLVLILSFAWNGLLLGILSIRQMEKIIAPFLAPRHELFFLYPIMWLNALGIYIGRYLRYNSWDVISDPFQLCTDIVCMLLHPIQNRYAWDMIFCFSILMTFMYLMLKKIGKALQ
jgi:uncharacterized membrane protein